MTWPSFFAPVLRRGERSTRAARACVVLLILSLCLPVTVLGVPNAMAQTNADSYADDQLQRALADVGLVDEWVHTSGMSAPAALVDIAGNDAYQIARSALLDDLEQLALQHNAIQERRTHANALLKDLDTLAALLRDVHRDLAARDRKAGGALTSRDVVEARLTLRSITGASSWFSVSGDMLTLAQRQLGRVRDDVARAIDLFSESARVDGPPLHALSGDVERIRSMVETTMQRAQTAEFEYAAHRAAIAASMTELHDLRRLSATAVGGLSTVTLDAYVRGAEALDPSCPVDWALLAGIGRVESRHGTVDDTSVQRSGRVSKPILGPLLDGGATEREAQAAAEAASEAEAALLQAEAEAEAAAAAAAQAALEALVWGEPAEEESDDEPVDEPRPSRYDPVLWGDDLPFDESDLPPLEDDDDDETGDDEVPEFRGNGFAVIRDSDNGRLDGNSRWDRAVGPMQFIPETWSYWETDGNGDGVADPQNLYDAAATAGEFLCHLSRTRGASPTRFVLGYNGSDTYVRNVLAVADAFSAGRLPGLD